MNLFDTVYIGSLKVRNHFLNGPQLMRARLILTALPTRR